MWRMFPIHNMLQAYIIYTITTDILLFHKELKVTGHLAVHEPGLYSYSLHADLSYCWFIIMQFPAYLSILSTVHIGSV